MVVIDATNLIVGRLATVVAKKALLGEKVIVVNSGEAVFSGTKAKVLSKFKEKRERGSVTRGPYQPRMADRLLRRIIRSMLPYKQSRGKEAFERTMCYLGVPEEFKKEKLETVKGADANKLTINSVKIKEISKLLGAKT